jgi:hypothetical protein
MFNCSCLHLKLLSRGQITEFVFGSGVTGQSYSHLWFSWLSWVLCTIHRKLALGSDMESTFYWQVKNEMKASVGRGQSLGSCGRPQDNHCTQFLLSFQKLWWSWDIRTTRYFIFWPLVSVILRLFVLELQMPLQLHALPCLLQLPSLTIRRST